MDDKRVNKYEFQWSYSTRQKYINWCLHLERMMKKFDQCPLDMVTFMLKVNVSL